MSGTTKTVAERLRDYAEGCPGFCGEFRKLTMGVRGCEDLTCTECRQQMLHALADAIEAEQAELRKQSGVDVNALKFCADHLDKIEHGDIADTIRAAFEGETYELFKQAPQLPEGIEWPRFEDGELVKFGHHIAQRLENPKDQTRELNGGVRSFTFAVDCLSVSDGKEELCFLYGEPVERPEPEVLDADGVPIKVGDTVWYISGGNAKTVKRIVDGFVEVEESIARLFPEQLTHHKPDTHGDIEDDATLPPKEYCSRYHLLGADGAYLDDAEAIEAMCKHLIERTRKLMGGE